MRLTTLGLLARRPARRRRPRRRRAAGRRGRAPDRRVRVRRDADGLAGPQRRAGSLPKPAATSTAPSARTRAPPSSPAAPAGRSTTPTRCSPTPTLRRRRRDVSGARALLREARSRAGERARPGCADATGSRRSSARFSSPQARRATGSPRSSANASSTVLRLLATDLSQREIGAELFVSFNTVKSHTRTRVPQARRLEPRGRRRARARARPDLTSSRIARACARAIASSRVDTPSLR